MYLRGNNQRKSIYMQRFKRGEKDNLRPRIRGEHYRVDIVDKKLKTVNDTYLMKLTTEGPIFQKQIYSRWKEELAKARMKQLTIITTVMKIEK